MPVVLHCDAPGCGKQIAAEMMRGVITAPKPWWILGLKVACSTEHVNEAIKTGKNLPTEEATHDQ
jgi:hypothetical protein